jgi:hypothetical protein
LDKKILLRTYSVAPAGKVRQAIERLGAAFREEFGLS